MKAEALALNAPFLRCQAFLRHGWGSHVREVPKLARDPYFKWPWGDRIEGVWYLEEALDES